MTKTAALLKYTIMFLVLFSSQVIADNIPFTIAPKVQKIPTRLIDSLSIMPDDHQVKVWVYFTDKNVFTDNAYKARIDNLQTRFSQKAIERRLKRTGRKEPFDFHDISVAEPYISQMERAGFIISRQSRWLNAVSGYANKSILDEISRFQFVAEIKPIATAVRRPGPVPPDDTGQELPPPDLTSYGESYWQLITSNIPIMHFFGFTGEGVTIAIFDTGFRLDHSALSLIDVVAQYDFVDDEESVDVVEDSEVGHGTKVLGLIAGYDEGELIGAAFNADFILARTEIVAEEIQLEEDNWVVAAEWAESIGADIITTSVGYIDWYTFEDLDGNTAAITIAAELASSLGVAVFASAGNERGSLFPHITPPADGNTVIAVGSVGSDSVLAASSSPGPTFDGRIKPDIVAKGVGNHSIWINGGYTGISGTSAAAPIAAGMGALLLEAHPNWSPVELRNALWKSGDRYNNPDNDYGYGLADALLASGRLFIYPVDPVTLEIGQSVNLNFEVAGLPDSTPVFTAYNLPDNAVFTDNNNRTATMSYLADSEDLGSRVVQISANVGNVADTISFLLSVDAMNRIKAGPNPFADSLTIFINSGAGLPTDISIHTLNGEKVWDNFTDNFNETTSTVVWRGENNKGEKVASGVYFVFVQTEHTVRKFKVFKR
jgi:subtilisin family serine protease